MFQQREQEWLRQSITIELKTSTIEEVARLSSNGGVGPPISDLNHMPLAMESRAFFVSLLD